MITYIAPKDSLDARIITVRIEAELEGGRDLLERIKESYRKEWDIMIAEGDVGNEYTLEAIFRPKGDKSHGQCRAVERALSITVLGWFDRAIEELADKQAAKLLAAGAN